jgi:hypothetical protein
LASGSPEGQDHEVPNPLDAALDLLVYVPVGLAITAAEELPKLAAKGRARVNTQMTMARVVGQFAVAEGRKQLERRWGQMASPAASSGPSSSADATSTGPAPGPDPDIDYEDLVGSNGQVSGSEPLESAPAPPGAGGDVPRSAELAIPGYDSLSASQVVQRLAGLSGEELAAVGAYEQAHRARRTILNRVSQLQGH